MSWKTLLNENPSLAKTGQKQLHDHYKQNQIINLFGTIDYDPTYNYKEQRKVK
jgi:hypothetical protein